MREIVNKVLKEQEEERARQREEEHQKLTPYLLPTQIQKLIELEGSRGFRPDGGGGRQR